MRGIGRLLFNFLPLKVHDKFIGHVSFSKKGTSLIEGLKLKDYWAEELRKGRSVM